MGCNENKNQNQSTLATELRNIWQRFEINVRGRRGATISAHYLVQCTHLTQISICTCTLKMQLGSCVKSRRWSSWLPYVFIHYSIGHRAEEEKRLFKRYPGTIFTAKRTGQ